jgi:hypothetical protein
VPTDLQRQFALARQVFGPFLALPPHRIACGAVFTGSTDIGGADADFIVDGLLLGRKAAVTPSRLGTGEIYQLAGYLLLDYDDQYGIDRVGLYLSRQGAAVTRKIGEFLELLGARARFPYCETGCVLPLARTATRAATGCPEAKKTPVPCCGILPLSCGS